MNVLTGWFGVSCSEYVVAAVGGVGSGVMGGGVIGGAGGTGGGAGMGGGGGGGVGGGVGPGRCYQPGSYGAHSAGHVAVVEQVRGGQTHISEASYRENLPDHGDHEVDHRWTGIGGVQFIHHRGYGHPQTPQPPQPPAPSPSVLWASLSPGQSVGGVISLSATASNAAGVECDAYYATNSQAGVTVNIAAMALLGGGQLAGARDYRRVTIANSQPQPPQPPAAPLYYVHHVTGTCRDGACGVKLRTGPGYSGYPAVGSLPEGGEADVLCQAMGETISNGYAASAVWDKLTNGDWVSDFYLNTPNIGNWSPPIPQC